MALTTNMKVWKIMVVIFMILALSFSILLYFQDIFMTIFLGLILILFTDKLSTKEKKKTHLEKTMKTLRFLFWIVLFISLFYFQIHDLSSVITNETSQSYNLYQYFTQLDNYVPSFLGQKLITFKNIESLRSYVFNFLSSIISGLSFFILNSLLIIPLMYYMYYNKGDKIKNKIFSLVPLKFKKAFTSATKQIYSKTYDFFSAKLVESTVIGFICSFGFFISGLKAWLLFGVISGLFNIIPYIGPLFGSIPALIIAFIHGPTVFSLTLITIIIAQIIDNIYLIPFMVSSKVNVDSLIAILLFLVGAKAMGPFGMIIIIPIYIIFKIVLVESYLALVKIYD